MFCVTICPRPPLQLKKWLERTDYRAVYRKKRIRLSESFYEIETLLSIRVYTITDEITFIKDNNGITINVCFFKTQNWMKVFFKAWLIPAQNNSRHF